MANYPGEILEHSRFIASLIESIDHLPASGLLDLPQVDLMNFRVEYVRSDRSGSRSGRASDEGLFRKSS